MNKKLFLLVLLSVATLTVTADVKIDGTTFPDSNFRNLVLSQEYGADGVLTNKELENVISLNVSRLEIHDLKGIEYFTSLKVLNCMTNKLTTLDLSKNTALEKLECNGNRLTTINLLENKNLKFLNCGGNNLTALDISGCTKLDTLACSGNSLTALDVSNNTKLICLECYSNQLTLLDLSKNTALRRVHCNNNQLTTLDVSKNTALTILVCSDNQLTTLDVTKNSALSSLTCMNNKLTTLYVSDNKSLEDLFCLNNQLTSLDVSGCSALKSLGCNDNQLTTLCLSGCPALEYVNCYSNQLETLDLSENTALTTLFCLRNRIKGIGMDALVESLPTVSEGRLNVMNFENEQNEITTTQVAAAKAKGWTPYIWTYSTSKEYYGSETSQGFFPEGTKWTEIRLDTVKYDSWYSKVGDEWVPNFETIEYYVKGEFIDKSRGDGTNKYKCVYTNGPEWTDSLTLLIQEEGDAPYVGSNNVMVSVLIQDYEGNTGPLWPGEIYQFDWSVGKGLYFTDILMSNTTSIWRSYLYYGIIDEIKEDYFGGVKPLKYVDLDGKAPASNPNSAISNVDTQGGRIIQGIGITEWNDGECLFGPSRPYSALAMSEGYPYTERHYRSILVHFERNGEVLYDVWPDALPQNDYRPFVEDGKVWQVGDSYSGNPVRRVEYYYFDGDTIIDGKTCKQMMCQRYVSPEHPDYAIISQLPTLSYIGAWYEENQKVYLCNEANNQFKLMYDFSVNANDTLQIMGQSYVIGPRQTRGINGFKGVYRDVMMCGEGENTYNTTWLEGVGNIDGPIYSVYLGEEGHALFLMSCTVGDEVIYYNDEYEDGATPEGLGARKRRFDFTHTIKTKPSARMRSGAKQSLYGEYNEQQLSIIMNPIDDAYEVRISDESGKVVYERVVNAGSIVGLNVNISAYAKGRYTVTVENNDESFKGEFETQSSGIEDVRSKMEDVRKIIYNLQGQRLNTLQKGLNIVNGQKIYVK